VPIAHGKADIQIYRDAGAAVISVLSANGVICERASVDEAYLDVTAGAQQLLAAAAAAAGGNDAAGVAAGVEVSAYMDNSMQEQQQQEIRQQQEERSENAAAAAAAGDGDLDAACGGLAGVAGAVLPLPESIEGWHVADAVGTCMCVQPVGVTALLLNCISYC
jgi:membrane protease subunit (stomatin/prohibitin family)